MRPRVRVGKGKVHQRVRVGAVLRYDPRVKVFAVEHVHLAAAGSRELRLARLRLVPDPLPPVLVLHHRRSELLQLHLLLEVVQLRHVEPRDLDGAHLEQPVFLGAYPPVHVPVVVLRAPVVPRPDQRILEPLEHVVASVAQLLVQLDALGGAHLGDLVLDDGLDPAVVCGIVDAPVLGALVEDLHEEVLVQVVHRALTDDARRRPLVEHLALEVRRFALGRIRPVPPRGGGDLVALVGSHAARDGREEEEDDDGYDAEN
mmetsp:Transcript_439/g.1691  ORF Transcript_439/g.1691 Transcript_439/m.1691 type:complete len:259 (-) Transcript_439:90-866(-)